MKEQSLILCISKFTTCVILKKTLNIHPPFVVSDAVLIILKVAKCYLGKVNLKPMLVSSFHSYTRGGPMPLAGAPRDLYTQLIACISSQSVVAIACCLRAFSALLFSRSLPVS